jgi:hypothetical protein
MLQSYHRQICQRALGNIFSPKALERIIAANLGQDHIRYQYGHPHFHYDDNAFDAGDAYIEAQRQIVLDIMIEKMDPTPAWLAFGRLTHAAQDFYAHSNYIRLWIAAQSKGGLPDPPEVDALAPNILHHPELKSGNVNLWDWLAFVPGFYSLAYRLAPEDSHTHMNLDSPKQGELFPYAFEAAVKRTSHEFDQITAQLSPDQLARFTDH